MVKSVNHHQQGATMGQIARHLTLASLFVFFVATHQVDAIIKTVGGGESVIFTGTAIGETQEIRTPVFNGFESFTISFWFKNVNPRSNFEGKSTGIPGSLWSYWLLSDGPSIGSGWVERRAKGSDVLQSVPLFSVYLYNTGRMLKHNNYPFTMGEIPYTEDWSEEYYYHYVFSYDGPNREINKYEDSSFCFHDGDCEYAPVERSRDNEADTAYLESLNSTRLEPGMFRFGQSDPGEPTLTMDLDDICIFNKSMSLKEAANIMDLGCDSVSGLVLNYDFDQRRTQSPDIYDSVSGTYNGISRPYLDLGNETPDVCSANTVFENMDVCAAALVPEKYNGGLTDRLQLDFGADIGPVRSNQGGVFSVSGKLNILRAMHKTEHIVTVKLVCRGQCRRFMITSLPNEGQLCWDSPVDTGNWTCAWESVIDNGTVIELYEGDDDPEMGNWEDRSAILIYYLPHGNSTAGARDTFNVIADSLQFNGSLAVNDTFESTTQMIQIITNTAPIAKDFAVELSEGGIDEFVIPSQSEYVIDPDGGRENIDAEILRIEIDQSSTENPPAIRVHQCIDCRKDELAEYGFVADIQLGNDTTSTELLPGYMLPPDSLRMTWIEHVVGTGTGLVTIVYRLFDQFDYSPEAKMTFNIVSQNKPPVVLPGFTNTLEDSGGVFMELGNVTSDVEGDAPLWRVSVLPENGKLHQVNADGSIGAVVRAVSASEPVQQWANGSMDCQATTAWVDWGCEMIDGPPIVFPIAGDTTGTYSPGPEWVGDPITLVLYLSEPVFLAELAFYFTWGPGAVVSIETQPFGDTNGAWEVVYEGINTMSSHCTDLPINQPCAAINRFRLCPKPYMTNTFRIILTVDLVDRYIILDTVLSQGTRETNGAIVTHPQGKLMWTPDIDFEGSDKFTFTVDDCPAFLILQMPPLNRLDTQQADFTTFVSAINDAPVVAIDATSEILTLGTDKTIFYDVPISIVDVDNEVRDLKLIINTLPEFGTLWVDEWIVNLDDFTTDPPSNSNETTQVNGTTMSGQDYNLHAGARKGMPVRIEPGVSINSTSHVLLFQANQCEDILMKEVEFNVTVSDTSGATSHATISFNADCTNLPQHWIVDQPGKSSIAFGIFASVFGLVLVAIAITFNIKCRTHVAVRMSSYRINIILFLGCSCIYIALLGMSIVELSPTCFTKGISEGRIGAKANVMAEFTTPESCIHTSCFSNIWLLDIGAALAWGSLYAKTYRIQYLFAAKSIRKKQFSDVHIATAVAKLVFLVAVTLLVLSIYIGTPSLTFTPDVAHLSETENAKLITVVSKCSGGTGYDLLIYLSVAGFTVLQIFSARIAYNVRNIKIKQVNDSSQIAFAIYTSLMIGLPGLGVASVVPSSDLSFVLVTFSIFLATTVVLLSMLLPRMYDVHNKVAVMLNFDATSGTGRLGDTKYGVDEEVVTLRLEVNELRRNLGLAPRNFHDSNTNYGTRSHMTRSQMTPTSDASHSQVESSLVSTFAGYE